MGHEIKYRTYPASWSLKQITDDVLSCVSQSGDRYGTSSVRVPTEKVFDSQEEAQSFIEKGDRHWYDGVAVKYMDFTYAEDTEKIKELRAELRDIIRSQGEYIKAHSVHSQKAKFIGCPSCGSKLNKDRLGGEKCPLCWCDLRAASTLERISSFDKRIEKCNEKIVKEQLKRKEKGDVKWLVKFEYHV